MRKKSLQNKLNDTLNSLIKNLGTNVGTVISILSILGMGFTAGVYYNDYKKNIEILDLKKNFFIELQDLKKQVQKLEIQNEYLEQEKKIQLIKSTK